MLTMPRMERAGAIFTLPCDSAYDIRRKGSVTGALSHVDGPIGRPATYFGGSSYATFASTTPYESGDLTVLAWIKPDAVSGYQGVVTKSAGTAGTVAFELRLNGDDVEFVVSDGAVQLASYANIVTAGAWALVAGTISGSTITAYHNGTAGSTTDTIGAQSTTTEAMTVGARKPTAVDLQFTGAIAEVVLFDRALSADEISAIHARTVWGHPKTIVTQLDMSQINPVDVAWPGNGNDGTGTNIAAADIVDGPYGGKAIDFDGTSELITVSNDSSFEFGTGDFSIVALAKLAATGAQRALVAYKQFNDGWELGVNTVPRIDFYLEGTQASGASTVLVADKWYTFGMSRISGNIYTFIDGGQEAGPTAAAGSITAGYDLYVAARAGGAPFWSGCVAKVHVYNSGLLPIQHMDVHKSLMRGVA